MSSCDVACTSLSEFARRFASASGAVCRSARSSAYLCCSASPVSASRDAGISHVGAGESTRVGDEVATRAERE
eukprot:scaffold290883_cov35-Tisochrysis_lutea.AAC.1